MSEKDQNKPSNVAVAVRAVIFLLLALSLFAYLNLAFDKKGANTTRGSFDSLYSHPANSVDVLYVGTSAASRFFDCPVAYNDYGIAAHTLGFASSPVYLIEDLINEAKLTQDPKLIVIELRGSRKTYAKTTEPEVRRITDSMNLLSPNRFTMISKALDHMLINDSTYIDFVFPLFKYHTRLLSGEMTVDDFLLKAPENYTQGFGVADCTITAAPQEAPVFTNNIGEINADAQDMLANLADYCDTLDADVLFVLAPYVGTKSQFASLNGSAAYLEGRGYTVLNYNKDELFDQTGFDWSTDLFDTHHANYLGAEKYTRHLCEYLSSHYQLEDRRGDPTYAEWANGYDYYADFTSQGILYDKVTEGED